MDSLPDGGFAPGLGAPSRALDGNAEVAARVPQDEVRIGG